MKIYHEKGNKSDDKGSFFGFLENEEIIDMTDPRVQKYCSLAK